MEDNCVRKRAPIEKISALIQKKEKKVTFLFALIVDFSSHSCGRAFFFGGKVSSTPKGASNLGNKIGQGQAPRHWTLQSFFFLFFSFRLVIDALMEDVPMTLHHVQMGLVTGSRWSGSDRSPPGIFFFGARRRDR